MSPFPSQIILYITLLFIGQNTGCEEGAASPVQLEPIPFTSTIDSSAGVGANTLHAFIKGMCKGNEIAVLPTMLTTALGKEDGWNHLAALQLINCTSGLKPENQKEFKVLSLTFDIGATDQDCLPFNQHGDPRLTSFLIETPDRSESYKVRPTFMKEQDGSGTLYLEMTDPLVLKPGLDTVLDLVTYEVNVPYDVRFCKFTTKFTDLEGKPEGSEQGVGFVNLNPEMVSTAKILAAY